MVDPMPDEENKIFERLRRGEINLKKAYKQLDQVAAGIIPAATPSETKPQPQIVEEDKEPKPKPGPKQLAWKICKELAAISVFLLVLIVLAGPVLVKSGYAPGFDTPSHMYITQRLAEGIQTVGRLPTIDPDWYSGLEITHKLPPLAYAPLTIVYLLTGNAMLASRVFYFLALGSMGLIMYVVIRLSHGGRLNSLAAAIIVPFSMAGISYDNGVLLSFTRYFTFLLFPIALYSAKRLVEGRLIHALILSVVISLMLIGHPMIGLISALWLGVYAFSRIIFERRSIFSFRYFIYAYAFSALLAFWYLGPFLFEESVWGTSVPTEVLIRNSTTLMYQLTHFEMPLMILVLIVMIFRFSAERLALLTASVFGFVYAWGAFGPIFTVLPQLKFTYPFLAFFPSVVGLTYLIFTSANLEDIRGKGYKTTLLRAGAGAVVLLLVAGVVLQSYLTDPFPDPKTSTFSKDEIAVSRRLRQEDAGGRVMPLGPPYGLIVHAIPLLAQKPSPEGQYTTIAPFYLQITQIYDDLSKGYHKSALQKLKRWNANYVLITPTLKQRKDFKGRKLEQVMGEAGYKQIYDNKSFTLYKKQKPTAYLQNIDAGTLIIGRFAPVASALFPSAIASQKSNNIDDYSLAELKAFNTIVLSGFAFKNKAAAEKLLKAYARQGGHLVIDMQSVDEASLGQDQRFLGVQTNFTKMSGKVTFDVDTGGEFDLSKMKPVIFPRQWLTIYYKGLSHKLVTAKNQGKRLPLVGYKMIGDKKAYFVGGNLFYFAFDRHNKETAGLIQNMLSKLEVKKPKNTIKLKPEQDSPEKIVFNYQADAASPVLISRTYSPHWRAVLDGQKKLNVTKTEGLMKLDLPKGDHKVRLYYGPTFIHPISIAISVMAWIMVVLAIPAIYRRKVKSKDTSRAVGQEEKLPNENNAA